MAQIIIESSIAFIAGVISAILVVVLCLQLLRDIVHAITQITKHFVTTISDTFIFVLDIFYAIILLILIAITKIHVIITIIIVYFIHTIFSNKM